MIALRSLERVQDNMHAARSFERVHPALADAHHLRTRAENERLQAAQQATQAHSMAGERTHRKRHAAADSAAAGAPPALQLPDWDRVVSPDRLGPGSAGGQAWRPASPAGKRVAPPDRPSPRTKHVCAEAMGPRAVEDPAAHAGTAAWEERELQARVAALERTLQVGAGCGSRSAGHEMPSMLVLR